MFTGIITDIGEIVELEERPGEDLRLSIRTAYDLETVAIGASIACSGVCLTVTGKSADRFTVDVSGETVSRTAPAQWRNGARLNLERSLKVGDELGGHIVTGHVDGVGTVEAVEPVEGSVHIAIRAPADLAPSIAAKGSVAVDGISLTVNAVDDQPDGSAVFHLNIIPHTAQWTTLGEAQPGRQVNLEIDVLARYLARMTQARGAV
ncbi:riboflavin synthase [Sandaracinobacter sp. RS1-74]|uniref:riboflavin synthase n=1 Tax=Sandaracinobacteroides sayramensis TaxID=2913411 RepID=UPI001EDAF6D3|nr:riboflavin synthase [Sandaracinobacteroides sayramensis]MCG2839662.1 riboflavin synthase [Sandaracinobacteroides sayramensis]